MRHTVGVRQSVILTRKLYYAAFCQGAIMTFDSKLRHYDVRHNGVRQSGMPQNTIPPCVYESKGVFTLWQKSL